MNQSHTHPMSPTPGASAWMDDRLTEARCILADAPQHPDSLVILVARVIAGQNDNPIECAEAIDLWRRLNRRPLHTIANAAFPNRGAA